MAQVTIGCIMKHLFLQIDLSGWYFVLKDIEILSVKICENSLKCRGVACEFFTSMSVLSARNKHFILHGTMVDGLFLR